VSREVAVRWRMAGLGSVVRPQLPAILLVVLFASSFSLLLTVDTEIAVSSSEGIRTTVSVSLPKELAQVVEMPRVVDPGSSTA